MDHILALSKGGEHCATNIAPACKPCNSKKGSR
jgi:5-methylcytosine-specific restriction endonuclease McrA